MPSPALLLRSPPFPGITPSIAAVSLPEAAPVPARDGARIASLFDAMRSARVGGSFWAPAPALTDPSAILCPRSSAEARNWLKALPEAESRRPLLLLPRRGWARRLRIGGAAVSIGDVDPWPLLECGAPLHLHGDDELAALGVIAGAPLRLHSAGRFAVPGDAPEAHVARVARVLLEEAAYRDPFADARAPIETAVARLADWRLIIDANRDIAAAAGIAWWKRNEIRQFLWSAENTPLRFARSAAQALRIAKRREGAVAIWPSRVSPELVAGARASGTALIRIEDGFIRSVGLGSNLFPPFSIAVDRRGIHYDPSAPSDLEHLLETAPFPPPLIARAEALHATIVSAGISKYGGDSSHRFPDRDPARQRLVLVPGQVEDDMSVLSGGGDVEGNFDLLRRVRAMEPDAEIWFRPHPDVDAGHRLGKVADADALLHADRIVRGGSMAALLALVDGVHVLTSLTGFEALLRGKDVTTHGVPFYAGWGLTRDLGAVPDRRTRRLTAIELVAGVLILYPRYLDSRTLLPCPPEILVSRFAQQHRPQRTWLTILRSLQGRLAGR